MDDKPLRFQMDLVTVEKRDTKTWHLGFLITDREEGQASKKFRKEVMEIRLMHDQIIAEKITLWGGKG